VRCSALQCVAMCCSVLQYSGEWQYSVPYVVACCSALQCVAVCRSVTQCVAVLWRMAVLYNLRVLGEWQFSVTYVCYIVLQCAAGRCRVLQCVAACCSTQKNGSTLWQYFVPYVVACCCALQCVAVCRSVTQCVAVLWNMAVLCN